MLVNLSSRYLIIFVVAIVALVYYIASKKKNPLGVSSTKGNTPFLNLYCTDFTALAEQGKIDPVIGRNDEIRKLIQTLARRSKNNAILLGPPGVGKTAIVEGLAHRVAHHEIPEELFNKRVLALDVATLMSGTKYRGEFEERAKKIVREIEVANRSIILFVDEIHALVQSQGSEGALNLSDILKPALSRGDLQMIGATTLDEYEKYIKNDAALERRFQTVEVNEPSPTQTLAILKGIKNKYREYHRVEFTDAALETAVRLSDELIKNRRLPDKAIDTIDEAAAMVKVADIHPAVTNLLYQAAVLKYPEVAELWRNIQEIDERLTTCSPQDKPALIEQREKKEGALHSKGIITVDSTDVEVVIKDHI